MVVIVFAMLGYALYIYFHKICMLAEVHVFFRILFNFSFYLVLVQCSFRSCGLPIRTERKKNLLLVRWPMFSSRLLDVIAFRNEVKEEHTHSHANKKKYMQKHFALRNNASFVNQFTFQLYPLCEKHKLSQPYERNERWLCMSVVLC